MTVEVEATVPADPETVWDLLADIPRIGEFSPECRRAAWSDERSEPHVGARFEGTNRAGRFEWDVTGEVVEADRPRSFAWVVHDGTKRSDRPSSTWRYDLTPTREGTLVRQTFVHGPGGSGVTMSIEREPDRATEIIEDRRAQLRENMVRALAAVRDTLTS